ncbi:MAG: hypothetical protein AAB451_02065 [Patescibacteria group bacterium]
MEKITRETILAEVLKTEGAEKILVKHNVPCLGCAMASMEMDKLKIGEVCQVYGIDSEKLLKDLNKN